MNILSEIDMESKKWQCPQCGKKTVVKGPTPRYCYWCHAECEHVYERVEGTERYECVKCRKVRRDGKQSDKNNIMNYLKLLTVMSNITNENKY